MGQGNFHSCFFILTVFEFINSTVMSDRQLSPSSKFKEKKRKDFFFFFLAVLGSQNNRAGSTESSHTSLALTVHSLSYYRHPTPGCALTVLSGWAGASPEEGLTLRANPERTNSWRQSRSCTEKLFVKGNPNVYTSYIYRLGHVFSWPRQGPVEQVQLHTHISSPCLRHVCYHPIGRSESLGLVQQ